MTDQLKSWFKEHTALITFLLGQAILVGIYMVNLEARVSTLEVRGSPHLAEINNRLTVTEKETEGNKESINRIVTIMTKELHINPYTEK